MKKQNLNFSVGVEKEGLGKCSVCKKKDVEIISIDPFAEFQLCEVCDLKREIEDHRYALRGYEKKLKTSSSSESKIYLSKRLIPKYKQLLKLKLQKLALLLKIK